MRSRGLLMLFIAAIAGLAAVVMAARWMQGQNGNQGRIAIANADIELGGRISREMVRMAVWIVMRRSCCSSSPARFFTA